jgi:hypothetical protein
MILIFGKIFPDIPESMKTSLVNYKSKETRKGHVKCFIHNIEFEKKNGFREAFENKKSPVL